MWLMDTNVITINIRKSYPWTTSFPRRYRLIPESSQQCYKLVERKILWLALKSNFILSLCELVVGSKEGGLQPEEKSIIDRCVRKLYGIYFQDPRPEKMPILEDLYNLLLEEANNGKEAANYIASALELYVTGSLNVFNNRSNVNLNNRLVCFNIRELQSHLKAIGMLILQRRCTFFVQMLTSTISVIFLVTSTLKLRKFTPKLMPRWKERLSKRQIWICLSKTKHHGRKTKTWCLGCNH